MPRTLQFTDNTMKELSKNCWTFSDFIDNSALDFKYSNKVQASYYYPGGHLILTKSTNSTVIADWIKE